MNASRRRSVVGTFLIAWLAAVAAAAQGTAPLQDVASEYREIRPGVFQRLEPGGAMRHVAVGPDGLAWALTRLHERSKRELGWYLEKPTAERWERILDLAKTIDSIQADLSTARTMSLREALQALERAAPLCDLSAGVSADAFPVNLGAGATASASWWNNCGQLGYVYCSVYAAVGSVYSQESKSGSHQTSISRSCSASVNGSGQCFSEAYAHVYVQGPTLYVDSSEYDENGSCGMAPLSGTLSCIQHPVGGGYPQVDCTGSASGGVPPYRAYWKLGSAAEYEAIGSPGGGPWTYSFTCKYLSSGFTPFSLRLRVVDGAGGQQTRSWYCGLDP